MSYEGTRYKAKEKEANEQAKKDLQKGDRLTTISGFTFVHNAIQSGYPIIEAIRAVQPYVDEVVVVDMQSTDNTREVLNSLGGMMSVYDKPVKSVVPIRIIDGLWGNEAGETLKQAHSQYIKCDGDIIVHFEADEVYDDSLIKRIVANVKAGTEDISVYRLQLEQNFQRCRWYPEPVHRVFPRLSNTRKNGHTTDRHSQAYQLEPKSGYLWDITNCFRDNWMARVRKQAELRASEPQYLFTPIHILHKVEYTEAEAQQIIYGSKVWTATNTPFNIPEILKPLVGMTKYEPS